MADCVFEGNAEMYGLGIRLGFYIQWYTEIIANWMSVEDMEVQNLRFGNSCLNSATFLAIIVSTSLSTLRPIDIYITLLLSFGRSMFYVPLYIWRIVTRFDKALDPMRWSRIWTGKAFSIIKFIAISGVAAFQIWFWIIKAPLARDGECASYGFIFARISLQNFAFRVVNCVLYSCLLFIAVETLFGWAMDPDEIEGQDWNRNVEAADAERKARWHYPTLHSFLVTRHPKDTSETDKKWLENLHSIISLSEAIIVNTATELTIKWNSLDGMYSLQSVGQMIPFVMAVFILFHVVYEWFMRRIPNKIPIPMSSLRALSGTGVVEEGSPAVSMGKL